MTRRSTMPPFSCFLGTCYNLDVISSLSPLLEAGYPRSLGFSGSPSRGKYLYSLSCRENLFSESGNPPNVVLGNPPLDSFGICSQCHSKSNSYGVAWERRRIYVH